MEALLSFAIDTVILWGPRVGGALAVLLVALLLGRGVNRLVATTAKRLELDDHLARLFSRSSKVVITTLGVVTALGTLGIDISALVAGLGLTGFALGFALKDTISNLLSGVLILLYRPFAIGDRIRIAGYEGEVLLIDLRYTELDCGEGRVLIPNSKLFTDPITVVTGGQQP